MKDLELTILAPTLDEAASLPTVLRHVAGIAQELTPSHEILVIDGGSTDGTPSRAAEAGARVVRQKGRGFGAAVREGLLEARGRWVISMDADGSHPAEVFRALWARREHAQLVVASRYMPGGSAEMPRFKHLLSVMLNRVSRWWLELPVADSSSGLRLYDGELLKKLTLSSEDFTVQQETMVRVLEAGGRVEEVPFHYAPRIGGESKARTFFLAKRYLSMLARMRAVRGWRCAPLAAVLVGALGLLTASWGLFWGLPGAERLAAWPTGRPSAEQAKDLAERWRALYAAVEESHQKREREEPVTYATGRVVVEPGWTRTPDALLNSQRSFLLQSTHPDEKKSFIVLSRMRPWRLQFQPLYAQYGGGFIYPLGGFLAAGAAASATRLTPALEHYLERPEDMRRLYALGRLFMALTHLALLALAWKLGRELGGWPAGAAAAALLALSPLEAWASHQIKPHAYASVWALAALLAAARGRLTLSGALAGVAAGSNLLAAPLCAVPVLAWLLSPSRERIRPALLGAAAAVGVFVALNPYLVFSYRDFSWELEVYSPQRLSLSWTALLDLARGAGEALGWAPAGLLLVGLAWALRAGGPARLAAALSLLAAAAVFLRFPQGGASAWRLYHAPVALAAVAAGAFAASLPRAARWALLCAAIIEGGLRSGAALEDMRRDQGRESTRDRAAAWIAEHVPDEDSIAVPRFPDPAHVPPFAFWRHRLIVAPSQAALLAAPLPDFVVVSEATAALMNAVPGYVEAARFEGVGGPFRAQDPARFAGIAFYIYRRR